MAASVKMTVFWVAEPCSLVKFTNVSEVHAASIIMAMSATHHVGKLLPDYTAQQPRRQQSSKSNPSESYMHNNSNNEFIKFFYFN
jgi:hypothetical protein